MKRGEAKVVAGSPFDKAGYKSDSLFKVVTDGTLFPKESIVWLHYDDNSTCPKFTNGTEHWFVYLPGLELVEEPNPVKSITLDGGWVLNNGTEPEFLLGGGTIDVMFQDGSIITNITDDNRDGEYLSPYGAYNWEIYPERSSIQAWRPSNSMTACSNPEDDKIEPQSPDKAIYSGISVTKNTSYTITIRDMTFELTELEYQDLINRMGYASR